MNQEQIYKTCLSEINDRLKAIDKRLLDLENNNKHINNYIAYEMLQGGR